MNIESGSDRGFKVVVLPHRDLVLVVPESRSEGHEAINSSPAVAARSRANCPVGMRGLSAIAGEWE
ncbi:hypothetical protein [Halomicronema sp. CCY15110]|uniref:hypothetical protein n=1 Tax=Halomicronema sp. CCY15110 TaxID=2767773 RepID=UPI00194EF3E1|nr:hypothetical protein [Halomicronema sp. CCY15110]